MDDISVNRTISKGFEPPTRDQFFSSTVTEVTDQNAVHSGQEVELTYRKVVWRLLPFLFIAYVVNQIDRQNIAFAKLQLANDLGLSDTAYGLGASMFLLGYIIFEVPSNLYMQKVGARATMTRIMVLWGVICACMSLVTTPTELYIARFLLGAAEAGFTPGVLLYLTYWFPGARRGRITSLFVMAATVSGVIGGPIAGWIMQELAGLHGLKGWQVLFFYEGIPAVILGIIAFFLLSDTPEDANWLTSRQKQILAQNLQADQKVKGAEHQGAFAHAFRDPKVYIAGFVWFSIYAGANTIGYWMPTVITGLGVSNLSNVGMLTSIPYIVAFVSMYLFGRSSDRMLERRWHVAVPILFGAASFALLGLASNNIVISMLLLSLATAACSSAFSVFWTIPPAFLTGSAAAAGIALISSLGGIAAFLSPIIVGWIKTRTGSIYLAFDGVALVLVLGATLLLIGIPAKFLRERKEEPVPLYAK